MQFLVDILPLGSGFVDPHIFADPDPGSQNLPDPTDPNSKHWSQQWKKYILNNYRKARSIPNSNRLNKRKKQGCIFSLWRYGNFYENPLEKKCILKDYETIKIVKKVISNGKCSPIFRNNFFLISLIKT